ncbi:hypothetical protein PINS_up016089 [Pythium insidiosum]|nr:hypothetical protein PINS_up016089 [Pythium insidiosum]
MLVPVVVQDAVASFTESADFTLRPPCPNESSFIYKWGVRVVYKQGAPNEQVGWICLADQHCRENINFIPLYSGKTSKATKHLKEAHNCTSDKTSAEVLRKRTREEEIEDLRSSPLLTQDPKRLRLLLETKRIILNQLPFNTGESDEAQNVAEICMKYDFQQAVNSKLVTHSIVEMYASAKREVVSLLREHGVTELKIVTLVADFWTCKPQHEKYLGVHVYFGDKDWRQRSILLGTRNFKPTYGDRDTGIRRPLYRWLSQMLHDFGLSTSNLFGGMSDAGPDVKWMLQSGLGLHWEWCIAHLSNAATKMACGLVNNKND